MKYVIQRCFEFFRLRVLLLQSTIKGVYIMRDIGLPLEKERTLNRLVYLFLIIFASQVYAANGLPGVAGNTAKDPEAILRAKWEKPMKNPWDLIYIIVYFHRARFNNKCIL